MIGDCYNPETNECDLRCQGCCDCPMAAGLDPSRRIMKLYFASVEKEQQEQEEMMKELDRELEKDPELKAELMRDIQSLVTKL